MKTKHLSGYSGQDIEESEIIYAPYIPLMTVDTYFSKSSSRNEVVFREYTDNDCESMSDRYLNDVLSSHIVGLEQKDGSVVVFKNGTKLKRSLRSRKIFEEKYFIEAI